MGGDYLIYAVAFGIFAFVVWLLWRADKHDCLQEGWLEKRLQNTDWKVVHDGKRLRSLPFYRHCARGFLGWNEARPLASHTTDERAAWLFKLNALETVARLVACVVRSSHVDFPRASLANKPRTMPFLAPRSSAETRARHPGLCKNWLVGTKDKSGRILTLLSSLEDVLSEVTLIREIETSGKHLMIVGECEFSKEHLPRFVDEAGRILESLGEGDLFVGVDWTES
jgi:hypothetical protein